MNRVVNPKLNKKIKKDVRSARTTKETSSLESKGIITRHPKAAAIRKKAASITRTLKSLESKRAKRASHPSKRTNPESVTEQSPPAFAHREGKRWMKTLAKQTKDKNVRLRTKSTKTR